MLKAHGWRSLRFLPKVMSHASPRKESRSTTSSRPVSLAGILATAALVLAPLPTRAAETLEVSYRDLLSVEIPVADLESFVLEGTLPPSIEGFSGLVTDEQFASARELLDRRLEIDPTMVSQFFNLPEGELVLNRVAQVLKDRPELDYVELLREALFQAASNSQGLTLLSAVQQFPAETLEVDLAAMLRLVAENAELYSRRMSVFDAFWEQTQISTAASETSTTLQPDLSQPGSQAWDKREIRFQNPGRDSLSPADLYLPRTRQASADKTPVIIISHGLGSDRQTLAYLAQHFASYGFATVVLEHTDTNSERFSRLLNGLADPPPPSDLINRPRDITAVLDRLSQMAQKDSTLALLNLESVGVLGQSLGGYTVLAAGGATIDRPLLEQNCTRNVQEELTLNLSLPIQCRILQLPQETDLAVQDPRVKAAIAINPLTSQIFGEKGLGQLDVPVMVVASTEDYFAPTLAEQVDPFRWIKTPEKYLLLTKNATHFSFLDNSEQEGFPLPEGFIGPEPQQAHPLIKAAGVAFFKQHLLSKDEADNYLTSTYLSPLIKSPFEARIVRSLDFITD